MLRTDDRVDFPVANSALLLDHRRPLTDVDPTRDDADAVAQGDLDTPEPFRKYAQYWLPGDELGTGRAQGKKFEKTEKGVRKKGSGPFLLASFFSVSFKKMNLTPLFHGTRQQSGCGSSVRRQSSLPVVLTPDNTEGYDGTLHIQYHDCTPSP